jgi:hypothetical protein
MSLYNDSRMFIFNENLEIGIIEGIIAFSGTIINYLALRKNIGYTRVSFRSLVNDCYFIFSKGVNLKEYLRIFFGKNNSIPQFIAIITFFFEVILTVYNQAAGFSLILIAFVFLIADFVGKHKHKVPKSKGQYLPLVMKGTQLQDNKTKRRPFLFSIVRLLVLLNGYAFFTFFLAIIVISFYDPSVSLNPLLAALYDVFLFLFIIGIFSPTYRDFKWLIYSYNLILNEIDKENDIYLRIYLDYPGASASQPLEGILVQIQPKMIIKVSDNKSHWYETVQWRQIKRISVRLEKRDSKQGVNIEPDFKEQYKNG